MHPLCCIAIDSPWISDPDPEPAAGEPDNADGSDVVVAGVLHKWTHFGRGWRSRWFSLRNGVLTYAKIQSSPKDNPDPDLDPPPLPEDVRLIGSTPTARSLIGIQQQQKTIGFVCLKVRFFLIFFFAFLVFVPFLLPNLAMI